jgi:AraC-like DNA-binding protein
LSATITATAGAWQPLHRHDEARLVLFLDGEMQEEAFEGRAHFARGDFVFRPSYFAHADLVGNGGSAFVRLPVSQRSVRHWVSRNGWRAARGHVSLDGPLCGDELLRVACAEAYSTSIPSTLMQCVAARLAADSAPRVEEAAGSLGMAPYQLTRRFLAEIGMTPSAYRRHARLQRAIRMLSDGAAQLAQIAIAAGFYDQSHLTMELRRETGLTPGALRGLSQ